jgi:hypothetical protein
MNQSKEKVKSRRRTVRIKKSLNKHPGWDVIRYHQQSESVMMRKKQSRIKPINVDSVAQSLATTTTTS